MLFNPQSNTFLRQLWMRLTDTRAARLDNLDALLSSRLSLTDAQALLSALTAVVQTRAMPEKMIVLNTPGAGNFIVPSGVYKIKISMCGAGSGCVYIYGGSSAVAIGNGGSGASIVDVDVKVTPGQVIPYVIGVGGNSVRVTAISSNNIYSIEGGDTSFLGFTCKGGGRASGSYTSSSYAPSAGGGQGGLHSIAASDVISGSVAPATNTLTVVGVHLFHGVAGSTTTSNSISAQVATTPLFAFDRAGTGGFVTNAAGSSSSYAMNHGRNGVIVIKMETAQI